MEKDKMLVVGHAMHGMSSAFAQILSKKDMIVIDSSDPEKIKEQLNSMPTMIEFKVPPELPDIEMSRVYEPFVKKKHKPNTGLQLGSYKYKSKRK